MTQSPRDRFWTLFLFACLIVGVVGFGAVLTIARFIPATGSELYSIAVAATSALFSALAFAGVIATLAVQRSDLQLQREEIALNRRELENQNKTLSLQRFESSFYSLLRAHRDIVDSISARYDGASAATGLRAIAGAASQLIRLLVVDFSPPLQGETLRAFLDQQVAKCCYSADAELGSYFRSLYQLLRYVYDSRPDDPWLYIRLIRSQLTNGERTLLFAYGLTSDGAGMKTFIERGHLLRGIRVDTDLEKYSAQYRPAAFGKSSRTKLLEDTEIAV
jgi:hypothetical protein